MRIATYWNSGRNTRFTPWRLRDNARLLETMEYYVPDAIAIGDYDLDNDLYDLNFTDLKEARKERAKQITSMKAQRSKLYAMIMKCLSPASVDIIKQQEEYEEHRVSKDPLALWQSVVATHQPGIASSVPAVIKKAAREAYRNTQQRPYESLSPHS